MKGWMMEVLIALASLTFCLFVLDGERARQAENDSGGQLEVPCKVEEAPTNGPGTTQIKQLMEVAG